MSGQEDKFYSSSRYGATLHSYFIRKTILTIPNETEYLASVPGESIVIPTPNDFATVDLLLFVSRLKLTVLRHHRVIYLRHGQYVFSIHIRCT